MGAYSGSPTVLGSWTEGGTTGKLLTCLQISIVLSSQGSETNPVPATALGLSQIVECSNFVKSDNSVIVVAVPDATGANLLLTAESSAGTPADQTGTFVGVVKGPLYDGSHSSTNATPVTP